MNDGFKTGVSSDDPLGGNDDADQDTEAGAADETGAEEGQEMTSDTDHESGSTDDSVVGSTSSSLPWIYARNSITDGRDRTVQLHLQASTVETQTTVRNELEAQLDENVRLADLREAAMLVGLTHTDEVVSTLQKWGYGVE